MADEQQGPERHINIHFEPKHMAGKYANFANVSHSDYEFTLTFARVDHEVEDDEIPGVVVARINLSPRFMRELLDAMEDNYSKWRTREGIKSLPEYDGPPAPSATTSSQRAPASKAFAIPIRSTVGGCVASSATSQSGGSGSATLRTRDAALEADERLGRVGQAQRVAVGARLDPPRELVGHDGHAEAHDRDRERQRRQRRRARAGGSSGASRRVSSDAAKSAPGATSAT